MPTERVLIVDDDPSILKLCLRILEPEGYRVTTATRGEDALLRLETESFDVLLTDIRLPGLDGLEVAARLRARDVEMVIITMTGYSNMEMAIQALRLGVDDFIIKPFSPDALRVHITRALDKEKLRRENVRLRTLVPLLRTAQVFSATRSHAEVYRELFAALDAQLNIENAAVLRMDNATGMLELAAGQGALARALDGYSELAVKLPQRENLLSDEVQHWNQNVAPRLPCERCGEWLASVALKSRGRVAGLLIVETPELAASNAEYLQLLAAQTATALENVDLVAQVSEAYINLSKLDYMKSEFINVAGHELRTPLAAILGYAKLLRDRTAGQTQEFVNEILANGERLQHIADDMLNLKYMQQGSMDLRLEEMRVERVLADVVNVYRPLADEKGQAIELDIAAQVGRVTADRAMLDLILGNILSNAIKFSPPNTQVRVAAEGDAEVVTLSVQDQGQGLTPEQAARVFEPFYQVSDSLTRSQGGIGLGLTLTREMVRAHGGKIWVESRLNRGSAFYVVLPRQAQGAKS